jgi:hypothetical protein
MKHLKRKKRAGEVATVAASRLAPSVLKSHMSTDPAAAIVVSTRYCTDGQERPQTAAAASVILDRICPATPAIDLSLVVDAPW